MKVVITGLDAESLSNAPEWETHPFSCKYCTYWESPSRPDEFGTDSRDQALGKKREWVQRTHRSFGNCGKIAYADGVAAGYAQFAPAELLPRAATYSAGPVSPGAVLISCLCVPGPQFRGLGLGSALLESVLAELRSRGIKRVETFARKGSGDNPSGPIHLYQRKGFGVCRDDAEFPLLGLDLDGQSSRA